MTEQEKLLEFLQDMANEAKGERKTQFKQLADMTKDFYDSFIESGFSDSQAFELTKMFLGKIPM